MTDFKANLKPFAEFEKEVRGVLENYIPDFNKCFVTGGFFARYYHNLPIRDIDVFVTKKEYFEELKQEYERSGIFDKVQNRAGFVKFKHKYDSQEIDLVGFHTEKEELNPIDFVETFDFTITRLYYHQNKLYTLQSGDYVDIQLKLLEFTGEVIFGSPTNNTLTRLLKYLDMGFKLSNLNDLSSQMFAAIKDEIKERKYSGYNADDKEKQFQNEVKKIVKKKKDTSLLDELFGKVMKKK